MSEERRKQFDADLDTPAPVRRSSAALAAAVGGEVIASRRPD